MRRVIQLNAAENVPRSGGLASVTEPQGYSGTTSRRQVIEQVKAW